MSQHERPQSTVDDFDLLAGLVGEVVSGPEGTPEDGGLPVVLELNVRAEEEFNAAA